MLMELRFPRSHYLQQGRTNLGIWTWWLLFEPRNSSLEPRDLEDFKFWKRPEDRQNHLWPLGDRSSAISNHSEARRVLAHIENKHRELSFIIIENQDFLFFTFIHLSSIYLLDFLFFTFIHLSSFLVQVWKKVFFFCFFRLYGLLLFYVFFIHLSSFVFLFMYFF